MSDTVPYRFALVSHSQEVTDCVLQVASTEEYDFQYAVATFESVVPLARKFLDEGREVVLGHGGSGRSIVRSIGHSVATIDRTDMDVIKALIKARPLSRRIALATFTEEVHDIAVMEKLLDVDIHHISYGSWEEMFIKIGQAYDAGVRVLVGGGISKHNMEIRGGTGFVIEPNAHSVHVALEHARVIALQKRIETARHADMMTVFRHLQDGVVCVDRERNLVFSNGMAGQLLGLRPGFEPYELSRHFDALQLGRVLADRNPRRDVIVEIEGEQFVVTAFPLVVRSGVPGAVALFRDVPSLQNINRKISDQLYAKGFVARSGLEDIRGRSPAIADLKKKVARFASTEATVLISGETGTGKELVAHAIHSLSPRGRKAFVAVNCAALPENLIESELFGYEDGAFTGARRGGKMGLFEMAGGGSIFLDEVGEISHDIQLRLLRVLEAREVMRVGGSRIRPVDVRVICASHRPLTALVEEGRFRLDLYFRLSTLKIAVPPLRERPEDIPLLLEKLLRRYGKPARVVSPAMLETMRAHSWPGNVRELLSLMETYLVLLDGLGADEALFAEVFRESAALPGTRIAPDGLFDVHATLKENMERVRSTLIRRVLRHHGGDKAQAARSLGVSSTTLWRILNGQDAA